jgi:L-seryl-tRNA(Ser) seleniumtransferase
MNFNRRSFLSTLGAATGSLLASSTKMHAAVTKAAIKHGASITQPHGVDGSPICDIKTGLGSTGNIYEELGVKPLVNIVGTVTVIGGSVMKPEVMELIRRGNEHFCLIDELETAAGKYIAKLCKSPAGYTGLVTGGAAAALVVGYAAMMTEDLEPRLKQIPDTTGFPKTEVIIQKSHRYNFDHQIRQTGAKLIEVTTKEEMIAAINPRTLAIHFTNIQSGGGISAADTIAIAKEHGLYTFNDASADVPPKERLWEYTAMGWDFITFSGGKGICGPQASGVLIGKEELIRWALLNMSPQEDRIGRCCKVGKETILGLLKALELFVNQDYQHTLDMYDARAQVITDAVKKFGVTPVPPTPVETKSPYKSKMGQFNPDALGNVTPRFSWKIDQTKLKITAAEVMTQLAETPGVGIGSAGAGAAGMRGRDPEGDARRAAMGPNAQQAQQRRGGGRGRGPQDPSVFGFAVWQIKDGEDKYIADRLVEIFSKAPKA